jgi:hypothetical protein
MSDTRKEEVHARAGRAGRMAVEHRRRLARALLHERHAHHLRTQTPDPKCPHCLAERPWPKFTSD